MSETLQLAPYYHPTTICLVDDNQAFLRSISLDLPPDWCCLSFLHAADALRFINADASRAPLAKRCFTSDNSDPGNPTIRLDWQVLEEEMQIADRFAQISVLLVDYAMPAMNGLELCAQIRSPHIKKILLTGVADEKTAVQAFNAGLIDRYLPKSGLTRGQDLVVSVQQMQEAFFMQYSSQLGANLALNPPPFLCDAELRDAVHAVFRRERIVEYYLAAEPYGYQMLRADGQLLRLVILSPTELAAQADMMTAFGAPQADVETVRAGRAVGLFQEHPADYLGYEAFPWGDTLRPTYRHPQPLQWHMGIFERPAPGIDFNPATSSYSHFMAQSRPQV